MHLIDKRNEFATRIAAYEAAHAAGRDVFGMFCEEDCSSDHAGALLYWMEQRPEPAFRQAAAAIADCL